MPSSSSKLLHDAVKAVDLAKQAGAQEVFAHASYHRSFACIVRDGKLEKLQENTSRSISLELYVDGRYAAHSTTRLQDDSLRAFVQEAVALTRALEPDPYRILPHPQHGQAAWKTDLHLVDASLEKLSLAERRSWCEEMNAQAAGKTNVISTESTVENSWNQIAKASSKGFQGEYAATTVGMNTSVTMRDEGEKRPESWMGAWARHRDMLLSTEQIGREALARTQARLGSKQAPTQVTTMIVDRMVADSLLWRLLSPLHGQSIQQQRSFWRGLRGKRKVSSKLTIHDDPTRPRDFSSCPFDREGLTAKVWPIIDQGVLANYYLDTYYARKLNDSPTTGYPTNCVVSPGKRTLSQMIADHKQGIYVTGWLGGNADPATGDFSMGVQGHLIRNGAIAEPIGEMNITGNLLQLFAHLEELGNDVWPYSSLMSPSLVFTQVQFSGS